MPKTLYYKKFTRKFKNNGIIYAGALYKPTVDYDYSWIRGVSIHITKYGDEPGCFDIGTLYYVPTYAEAYLIGAKDNHRYSIPLKPVSEEI